MTDFWFKVMNRWHLSTYVEYCTNDNSLFTFIHFKVTIVTWTMNKSFLLYMMFSLSGWHSSCEPWAWEEWIREGRSHLQDWRAQPVQWQLRARTQEDNPRQAGPHGWPEYSEARTEETERYAELQGRWCTRPWKTQTAAGHCELLVCVLTIFLCLKLLFKGYFQYACTPKKYFVNKTTVLQ